MSHAAERKNQKYQELRAACSASRHTTIITLEVGSRGFIEMEGFRQLYKLLNTRASQKSTFETDLIRHVVLASYDIWCKRNWIQD